MKNKNILISGIGVAVFAIILIAISVWSLVDKEEPKEPVVVTNFEECVEAGNPVMESYPRQCRHGDETFTEAIFCTQEVMLCPDGETYVGRTGPFCEFAACPSDLTQEEVVYEYIKANISILSPEPEVLGGTFYVTNISFTSENSGVVKYVDGHIALIADFTFSIGQEGNLEVQLTNAREAGE